MHICLLGMFFPTLRLGIVTKQIYDTLIINKTYVTFQIREKNVSFSLSKRYICTNFSSQLVLQGCSVYVVSVSGVAKLL